MIGIDYIHKKGNNNLILFVHGFTGSKDTWKNSNEEYFPEMLLGNINIKKNFDVAYFNYYSKLIEPFAAKTRNLLLSKIFSKKPKKNRKNLNIYSIAEYMSSTIRHNCDDYENIIIIAHSMGGLITKAFILDEIKEYGNTKVKLFLSLAVPHLGSNLANYAKLVKFNNIQINDLTPLNDTITELGRSWIGVREPESIYFIGQYDDVVGKNSGIPIDNGKQDIVYCDDDHISISKPDSSKELIFVSVEKKITKFLEEQKIYENIKVKKFNDKGIYDDELFVVKLMVADIDTILISGAKQKFYNAEYLTKILSSDQLKCLEEVYIEIKDLYVIYYGKFISKEIKCSNEFLTKIHEKIREDNKLNIKSEKYKKVFSLVSHIHKTGMLHQLANKEDSDIFWKANCQEDIKRIIEEKKDNE